MPRVELEIRRNPATLRAPERIKSTILLVFLPVFCVASEGTTNEVAPSAAP